MTALGRPASTSLNAIENRWKHLYIPEPFVSWPQTKRTNSWKCLVRDEPLPSAHQAVIDVAALLRTVWDLQSKVKEREEEVEAFDKIVAVVGPFCGDYW